MKSAPTIAFDCAPSRALRVALAGVTVLAALAPWLSALPWLACGGLSLCALAGGTHAGHRLLRLHPRRIACRADGWVLLDATGAEHAAELLAWRQLGSILTLDWRVGPRARRRVVLTPDNLDADTRRRLVVLLRAVAHAVAADPLAR